MATFTGLAFGILGILILLRFSSENHEFWLAILAVGLINDYRYPENLRPAWCTSKTSLQPQRLQHRVRLQAVERLDFSLPIECRSPPLAKNIARTPFNFEIIETNQTIPKIIEPRKAVNSVLPGFDSPHHWISRHQFVPIRACDLLLLCLVRQPWFVQESKQTTRDNPGSTLAVHPPHALGVIS